MKSLMTLAIASAISLTACSIPSTDYSDIHDYLALACPTTTGLTSREFGAVVNKLAEVTTTYRQCRAAALRDPKEIREQIAKDKDNPILRVAQPVERTIDEALWLGLGLDEDLDDD